MLYMRCAAIYIGKDVIAIAVWLPDDEQCGRATVRLPSKVFYGVLQDRAMAGLTGWSLTWLRRPSAFTAC
jgi:transposase